MINQLAANQQVMQQQFAAVTTQRNTTYQPPPPPPITQFTIPNYTTFPTSRRGGGDRRGGRGCGGRANLAITGGRNTRTQFANFMGRGGQGRIPPIGVSGGRGGGITPFAQQSPARNAAPMYSNIIKRYVNWNVCVLCDFDIEDGHTSKMCPAQWRWANHQEGFNQANLNQYIAAGYNACTKAIHKSQLPS